MFTINYLQVIGCEYDAAKRNSSIGNSINVAKNPMTVCLHTNGLKSQMTHRHSYDGTLVGSY